MFSYFFRTFFQIGPVRSVRGPSWSVPPLEIIEPIENTAREDIGPPQLQHPTHDALVFTSSILQPDEFTPVQGIRDEEVRIGQPQLTLHFHNKTLLIMMLCIAQYKQHKA